MAQHPSAFRTTFALFAAHAQFSPPMRYLYTIATLFLIQAGIRHPTLEHLRFLVEYVGFHFDEPHAARVLAQFEPSRTAVTPNPPIDDDLSSDSEEDNQEPRPPNLMVEMLEEMYSSAL